MKTLGRLLVATALALIALLAIWGTLTVAPRQSSAHPLEPAQLPLHFDFETGVQGWHIRVVDGQYYGTAGSEQVVNDTCPQCSGTQSFEFCVNLRSSRENRGQIVYNLPLGGEISADATFTAWLWIPSNAPNGLEAEFFVQSGENGTHWTASRPRVTLMPGEWVRLVGKGNWSGGPWSSPLLNLGVEVKALDDWPVPVGQISVRVDDIRVFVADQDLFLPLVFKGYASPVPPRVVWDYRGASIAGYWEYAYASQGNVYEMIDHLKAIGVNAITVLATWYQDGFTTSQIVHGPMTPRDEDVIALIQYAHAQGIQVMLKPHVDPLVGWRGHIAPASPSEWFDHFTNDFLLHYAQMAEDHNVEMLVIGTEYDTLVKPPYIDYWADVIAAVRQVYHGQVTYAATEHSLFYDNLPDWFWQSLDMVSLTLYHEFSQECTPTVAQVVQKWNTDGVLAELQSFHQKYNLLVLLAEVGYRSIDYAGVQAWRTEGPNAYDNINPELSIAYNGQGQANLYEALFQVLGDKEWFAGIFMWQYVPSGGCAGTMRGGSGNTDYTVLGKPAALVIHDWFGGPAQAPPQWTTDICNPLVHTFEYWAPEYVDYGWQVATSGEVTFTVDITHHPPLSSSTRSLIADTHVPLEEGRFQQMDYFFCDGDRDWSDYNSIELWVRTDMQSDEPQGYELAIGIIDGRSQEREFWQSSQWLERNPTGVAADGWRRMQVALTDAITTEHDPWRHPTDFVIPTWEEPVNGVLDLSAVRGIRLKTLTADDDPAYPDCRVWLGPMRASMETVEIIPAPNLPVIDAFEYEQAETVARVWKTPSTLPGTVTFSLDPGRHAPGTGSTRALHIHTHTPCTAPRFEQVTNFLLGGGVDLTDYITLELWAGGDLLDAPPYGGEFSIVLEDKDGECWQSTRWLGRTIQGTEYAPCGMEPVRLSLTSYFTDPSANPWHHPVDFVLADEGAAGNKQLDRDWIQSITLKTLTTDEYCATHPDYDVWIDHLTVSSAPVIPPELVAPPVIDHFEYADKETARVIWKVVSSGQMNVTMDTTVHAPGSARSMHINSDIPYSTARYGQAFNVFIPGVQDLSAYSHLRFWARTASATLPPYGGELSIELVETAVNGAQEVWRNTHWFGNSSGAWITIDLAAGANVVADPWDPTYSDTFVVPRIEDFVDGVLDLTRITEVRIIALTTLEDAQDGYTQFDLWVDEMTVE
jgi:hypothetical protein